MESSEGLKGLAQALLRFREERDWAVYHTPKNLAVSLSLEAAEVLEHFQWLTDEEVAQALLNPEKVKGLSHEMADVLIYLVLLAETVNVDLLEAAWEKLALNRQRYPPDQCRGRADKYTAYEQREEENHGRSDPSD